MANDNTISPDPQAATSGDWTTLHEKYSDSGFCGVLRRFTEPGRTLPMLSFTINIPVVAVLTVIDLALMAGIVRLALPGLILCGIGAVLVTLLITFMLVTRLRMEIDPSGKYLVFDRRHLIGVERYQIPCGGLRPLLRTRMDLRFELGKETPCLELLHQPSGETIVLTSGKVRYDEMYDTLCEMLKVEGIRKI